MSLLYMYLLFLLHNVFGDFNICKLFFIEKQRKNSLLLRMYFDVVENKSKPGISLHVLVSPLKTEKNTYNKIG